MKQTKAFEWTKQVSIGELKSMGFKCQSQLTTHDSQYLYVDGQKFNCSKTAAKLLSKHKDYEDLVLDILRDKETGIAITDQITGKPVVILQSVGAKGSKLDL